jgi:multidrug efflux pump
MDVPEGYEIKMTGEQEQQAETGSFLVLAFGMALSLMLVILVTQFNSVVKPMIIFSTVAFSLIGVALGFAATHKTFSCGNDRCGNLCTGRYCNPKRNFAH